MPLNEKKLQEKIDWRPHPKQQELIDCEAKDIVVCAGRRFGKSAWCAYEIIKRVIEAIEKEEKLIIWIVSPTYELAGKVFNYVIPWMHEITPLTSKNASVSNKAPQRIALRGNRGYEQIRIECKSATEPNSLLGESVNLLIVDECSRISRMVYEQNLRATTKDDPNARTLFISTPFGKNWFYDYWMLANKPEEKKMAAFHFESRDNPHMPEGFWEEEKRLLPEDVFNQEYAAKFLEGAGTVFRGVSKIIDDALTVEDKQDRINNKLVPQLGHQYIMGLDLAKLRDYTVITVIDKTNHKVVFWDRFNRLPYTMQTQRIAGVAQSYHAKIIMDSNNVGTAIGEDLRAYGLTVQDFSFVGTISKDHKKRGSKEQLIEKLSSFIEEQNVFIPRRRELVDELESYSYVLSDAGNLKYAAPSGLNDDCVDSLALAVWDLKGKKKLENIKIKKALQPRVRKTFQYL